MIQTNDRRLRHEASQAPGGHVYHLAAQVTCERGLGLSSASVLFISRSFLLPASRFRLCRSEPGFDLLDYDVELLKHS